MKRNESWIDEELAYAKELINPGHRASVDIWADEFVAVLEALKAAKEALVNSQRSGTWSALSDEALKKIAALGAGA